MILQLSWGLPQQGIVKVKFGRAIGKRQGRRRRLTGDFPAAGNQLPGTSDVPRGVIPARRRQHTGKERANDVAAVSPGGNSQGMAVLAQPESHRPVKPEASNQSLSQPIAFLRQGEGKGSSIRAGKGGTQKDRVSAFLLSWNLNGFDTVPRG